MCDPSPIRNWLLAVLAAIAVAIGLIIAAAVANGSFWLAYTSPVWMLLAAAATALAIFLCGQAMTALDVFCTCAGPRCAGPCTNMRNTINAARAVLGIQATTCLAAALAAWIPIAGQVLMWIIIGALVIQVALIISAIVFIDQLTACAKPAPSGPGSGTGGLTGDPTKTPRKV